VQEGQKILGFRWGRAAQARESLQKALRLGRKKKGKGIPPPPLHQYNPA
jgi:hypothetical protein